MRAKGGEGGGRSAVSGDRVQPHALRAHQRLANGRPYPNTDPGSNGRDKLGAA